MDVIVFILGLVLVLSTLLDGFETILLPRRIQHRLRYSRLYYRGGWMVWRRVAGGMPAGKWREAALGVFGPASMLGLFGSWVASLVVGFALMHWAAGSRLLGAGHIESAMGPVGFRACVYFSGTTFFTLGLGDVSPVGRLARTMTVAEAGLGFAFLAVVIGYLPVLYQAFSRREATISLLDARAGSPPAGGEFVVRVVRAGTLADADAAMKDWERWCAELLESHVSFPVVAYYRSQHANQSWLAALTTMLDACAVMLASLPARETYQAQLTFAMARHAAVDVALIFGVRPGAVEAGRFSEKDAAALWGALRGAGLLRAGEEEAGRKLAELRGTYEPFLEGLARFFVLALPPVYVAERAADNWQRSAWLPRAPGIGSLPAGGVGDGSHFD